ncbi:methyl-accepting chemotaxis protein [Pseudomonas aeruginosa]|uniref:methyl-accepting chemotaxis protein n=1 Tax=Pseudomonas aeruginosa TaxID=287 RepID=UPI0006524009|nr:methyl-accepting chemotaxis protein [Pseudomonas aeruginosa]
MRNNQPITQHERVYPAEQRLITTTNLKGIITYCNEAFIDISGFSREELMSAPHNLIRHPDVPPAVFAHMWTTLKAGRPWMGIVKNRCKNGDHYWVSAYVTPIYDQGAVVGYESVRVKPTAEQIQRAEALYRRLGAGKPAIPRRDRWLPVLLDWLPFILISQIGFLIGIWLNSWWGFILAGLLAVPLGLAGLRWQKRGLKRLMRLAEQTTSDPLIAQMYTDSRGDQARLEMAILSQDARLKTCLTRLQDTAEYLTEQARQADTLAHHSSAGLEQQRAETEQVATAVNEMTAAVEEVARNASSTSDASSASEQSAQNGRQRVLETVQAIRLMSEEVDNTSALVGGLAEKAQDISKVLDVIRGIAEQTNLLALNAAIEAARAGEQGRGFAVVADEVRALAHRTQESTREIEQMIANIQEGTGAAVGAMDSSSVRARNMLEIAEAAGLALNEIAERVGQINERTLVIASASEQQAQVAREVDRNLVNIRDISLQTSAGSNQTAAASQELSQLAIDLNNMVTRFVV